MKITLESGESFSTVRRHSTPSWPEVVPGEKFMSSNTTSKGSRTSAAASFRGSLSVTTRRNSFLSTSSAVSSTSVSSSTIKIFPGMPPPFMFRIETQHCFEMEQPGRGPGAGFPQSFERQANIRLARNVKIGLERAELQGRGDDERPGARARECHEALRRF